MGLLAVQFNHRAVLSAFQFYMDLASWPDTEEMSDGHVKWREEEKMRIESKRSRVGL